jgi:hypothetical protein
MQNHTVSICLLWNRYEPLCKGIALQLLIITATMASLGFAWLLQLSYDWVPKPTMLVISSIDSETLLGSKHRPHVPTRSGSQVHGPCARWLAGLFGATLCCALPLKLRVGSTVASKRTILLYQPFRFRLQGSLVAVLLLQVTVQSLAMRSPSLKSEVGKPTTHTSQLGIGKGHAHWLSGLWGKKQVWWVYCLLLPCEVVRRHCMSQSFTVASSDVWRKQQPRLFTYTK